MTCVSCLLTCTEIKLTWAAYDKNEPHGTTFQRPLKSGGAVVDVATGRARFVQSNKPTMAVIHGILMLLSFGLLLPVGTLLSRHRWIFNNREVSSLQVLRSSWLNVHVLVHAGRRCSLFAAYTLQSQR
jgi:hypothetical protein